MQLQLGQRTVRRGTNISYCGNMVLQPIHYAQSSRFALSSTPMALILLMGVGCPLCIGGVAASIRWAVGTRQFGLIERQDSLGRYVQAISQALPGSNSAKGADTAVPTAEHVARAGMLFGNLCDVQQLDGCSLGLAPTPVPSPSGSAADREDAAEDDAIGEWWMPPLMARAGITNPGVSVGPSRAGLPWHNHDSAWQAVVRGEC